MAILKHAFYLLINNTKEIVFIASFSKGSEMLLQKVSLINWKQKTRGKEQRRMQMRKQVGTVFAG